MFLNSIYLCLTYVQVVSWESRKLLHFSHHISLPHVYIVKYCITKTLLLLIAAR